MNQLKEIFWELRNRKYVGTDTYQLFSEFYEADGKFIEHWMNNTLKEQYNKSDEESDTIRKGGNSFFIKLQLHTSLQYYTQALKKAKYKSKAYALALANRSAVFYSLREYEYCLQDIDRCLKCDYPNELMYKIFVRRINCYDQIGNVLKADSALQESLAYLNNMEITQENKEIYVNKLMNVKRILSDEKILVEKNCKCKIPFLIENNNFVGASDVIGLRYNSLIGRHVIAECDINVGDILFVEKAFTFAPVFDEDSILPTNKCYYCLNNTKALIPCVQCSVCLYCNEDCQSKSWTEVHKWECKGMTMDLWNIVGVGFLALKIFLKGVQSIEVNNGYLDDLNIVRSKAYGCVDELVTNISKIDLLEFFVLTGVVFAYLEHQTSFFEWLSEEINVGNDKQLRMFCGGLLLKHAAQVACNASVIEHWVLDDYEHVPKEKDVVATGLYSSVSMMNHSCRPNISMYYIQDVVIVKAVDSIKRGDEILNCYGVDYRYATKQRRQSELQQQYQFLCACSICANPKLEMDYFDAFRCIQCSNAIISLEAGKCRDCGHLIDTSKLTLAERRIEKYLEQDVLHLEDMDECTRLVRTLYNSYHVRLAECYDRYKAYYVHTGRFEHAMKYFLKSLKIRQKRLGPNSRTLAEETIQFLDELKKSRIDNKTNAFIQDVRNLHGYVMDVLPLYYPGDCIDSAAIQILSDSLV